MIGLGCIQGSVPAFLRIVHAVILEPLRAVVSFTDIANNAWRHLMKTLFKLLIPLTIVAVSGCVVAPYGYGYHRGYYGYYGGPRVAIVAPAPVLVVRP
jgi:hypothetical protein